MSSNCPPQLQLSLQPNTTSFKRSFEQFGFDLESPVVTDTGTTAATSDGRNERNKRARSASSFDSETSSDLSSDTIASTSSSGSSQGGAADASPLSPSIEPPRLPTPEIQGVEMPDYPGGETIEVEREEQRGDGQFRLALERFNAFDNEIEVLRQSPSSSTASPPTLPPLRHRLLPDGVAFFRRNESTSSPFSSTFFDEVHPATNNSDSPQSLTQPSPGNSTESAVPSDPHFDVFRQSQPFPPLSSIRILNPVAPTDLLPTPGFRDRLDSALERLRSPSPLVPGLDDDQDQRVEPLLAEEEEEEEDELMTEREAELETEEVDERRAVVHELPPTLPPIRTVDDFLTDRTATPAPSTTQSVPLDPPTLPPIPAIAGEVVVQVDAADRAWHGRSQLFTERFDDFMGMSRNVNSAPELDYDHLSPSQSPSDVRETTTSPRPFSRSARSAPSSSGNRTVATNPSLGDHPLPSPILRDLHSWLEERIQLPSRASDANYGQTSSQADDTSSVSSISTTAATAGTERDTSTSVTMSSSNAQGGSSTASESSTTSQQDRLSRMLDRIRTGGRDDWAGQSVRRPWLPPAVSGATSVEPDGHLVRDALQWFASDYSPASAWGSPIPSAAPAASRPISTTPAPGGSPLNPGEDAGIVNSFWEPVFTNLPEAAFSSPQQSSSSTRVGAESPSRYSADAARSSPDAAGGSINPADVSNNGDHRVSDPTAGIWRPLEAAASDLLLNLSFHPSSQSSPNSPQRLSTMHATNDTDDIPSLYQHAMRVPYGNSQVDTALDASIGDSPRGPTSNSPETNSTTNLISAEVRRAIDRRASAVRREETLAMRELFDVAENMHQQRTLAPSSLINWNGRSPEEDGSQAQTQNQNQNPSSPSSATAAPMMISDVSMRNPEISSSAEPRMTDPFLRHRLMRSAYSSQTRLGSSSSLVTENASEARRRADHAEVRRLPMDRFPPSLAFDVEGYPTDSTYSTGQTRRPQRELARDLVPRSGDGFGWHRVVTTERTEPRMPHSSGTSPFVSTTFPSLTTFVDGLDPSTPGTTTGRADEQSRESQHPTPVSERPSAIEYIYPSYIGISEPTLHPLDAATGTTHRHPPTLPPPDLGSSFTAGPHPSGSRPTSAQWSFSENTSPDDPMRNADWAMPTSMSSSNVNETPNNAPQRYQGRRPVFLSSMMSPPNQQIPEHEQQNERPTLYQITAEERTRRFYLDRRLEEDRRRFASESLRPNSSQPPALPTDSSAGTTPTSTSTTAASIASGSRGSRSSLSDFPRPLMRDSSGRHALFDPSTFTAGPFRNTLQHFVNEREGLPAMRSESNTTRSTPRRPPPYIPPLSFDNENEHLFSSPRQTDDTEEAPMRRGVPSQAGRERGEINGTGARMAPRIIRELPFERHSPSRTMPREDFESHAFPSSRLTSPTAGTNEATNTNDVNRLRRLGDNRSSAMHMHRYLSQQARMEATRLEDPRYSFYPPSGLEPLHPDDLQANTLRSVQLIQRYHRERERERELSSRTEEDDDAMPGESINAQRARTHRRRLLRAQEAAMSFSRVSVANAPGWRRGRVLGDFMRDEDFDDSYENLLSLSMQIGEAKPRATPAEILEKMEKGVYKNWATEGSDTRCPICLDDYAPSDPVQKLSNCSHWLHQECLTQWLQTATTCPVCRGSVNTSPPSPFGTTRLQGRYRAMHPFGMAAPRRRRDSSPTAPPPRVPNTDSPRRNNQPSSPSTLGTNHDSRDTSNRSGSQGSNGSNGTQENPSRSSFGAPWRFRNT